MKNNKKRFLSVALIFLLLLSSCLMCACVEYQYTYYYSVEGGNGTVSMFVDDELFESDNSPIQLMGGLRGIQQFAFLAVPSKGYRVKQWTCDGEIVQGNKTVLYMCDQLKPTKGEVRITVEFEPIDPIISDIKSVYINNYIYGNTVYPSEVDVTVYHATDSALFALIECDKTDYLKTLDSCLDKCFPSVNGRFWVFSNNKLYSLYGALSQNIISESEFYAFVAKCNPSECKPFVSSFKQTIELSDDLKKEMTQKYWEQDNLGERNIAVESLSVRCLGNFKNCQVIFIDGPFAYFDAITYDYVGNVVIQYGSSHKLLAYKEGVFYTLSQAYSKGYIAEEEVLTIK